MIMRKERIVKRECPICRHTNEIQFPDGFMFDSAEYKCERCETTWKTHGFTYAEAIKTIDKLLTNARKENKRYAYISSKM